VESSSNDLWKKFLLDIKNAEDKRLERIGFLLERDRFSVDCFDKEIQEQLREGRYGEFGKKVWET
jgi:hypothetical protein